LANQGGAPIELTGWTVKDEHGWTYTFPTFTLEPGAKVQLYMWPIIIRLFG
jgi:hypothetical protein